MTKWVELNFGQAPADAAERAARLESAKEQARKVSDLVCAQDHLGAWAVALGEDFRSISYRVAYAISLLDADQAPRDREGMVHHWISDGGPLLAGWEIGDWFDRKSPGYVRRTAKKVAKQLLESKPRALILGPDPFWISQSGQSAKGWDRLSIPSQADRVRSGLGTAWIWRTLSLSKRPDRRELWAEWLATLERFAR